MPNQIIVPPIPEIVKTKEKLNQFGPADIKWVKTVNDGNTFSAYIPPDNPYNRVIQNSDGIFFCLQLNPRFHEGLNAVPFGDIILLYQYLLNSENIKTKCFTHLVTPIGDNVIDRPYGVNSQWPGRWVKVIAITENNVIRRIPVNGFTIWEQAGFDDELRYLNCPTGRIQPIILEDRDKLLEVQNNIWNRFERYRV